MPDKQQHIVHNRENNRQNCLKIKLNKSAHAHESLAANRYTIINETLIGNCYSFVKSVFIVGCKLNCVWEMAIFNVDISR